MIDAPAKTAIIVGVGGQDGSLLKLSLERQGVAVIGINKTAISCAPDTLSVTGDFSVLDRNQVENLVSVAKPDEIYYLAAYHASSEAEHSNLDPEEYRNYERVHVQGLLNFLYAICRHRSDARLFYASSSLIYDGSSGPVQDEDTPLSPTGYYGLTKVQGMLLCREFRRAHGVFAASGILYNHESILRPESFLSKKLIMGAHRISLGLQDELLVGSLDAETDWGYAPDYVEAFQEILRTATPDDFVIATGKSHTVREFAEQVFDCFNLAAGDYLKEDRELLHRAPPPKIGNPAKLAAVTGWKAKGSFAEMVQRLVDDYLSDFAEHSRSYESGQT